MLRDVRGFMFDLDGTLVRRTTAGKLEQIPGAADVLAAIRASGRPLVVFTNASHTVPRRIAQAVSESGIDLAEDEVLTPICAAIPYLLERHAGGGTYLFGTAEAREQLEGAGVRLVDAVSSADVILVAHVNAADLHAIEAAAWAVIGGARFLTANYTRAYAGASGPILSRGAMVTAAIAKASGRRPTIVGKPSYAAIAEVRRRLDLPLTDVAVIGDDLDMDIALGRLGRSRTVLVGTGISGPHTAATARGAAADISIQEICEMHRLL